MIGKQLRGFRHLNNSVGNLELKNGIIVCGNRLVNCDIYKYDDHIFLIQDCFGERLSDCFPSSSKLMKMYDGKLPNYAIRCARIHSDWFMATNNAIIILPNNFNDLIKEFVDNNKKLMNVLISKYCNVDNVYFKYFFALASESPNLVNWAVINIFKYNASFSQVKNIVVWNNNYGKLPNKPSKGSITSYNGDQLFGLEWELAEIRANKRSNDVVNTFNTAQKKVLKSATLGKKEREILNRFSTLSSQKKSNFIRKMSTVEDFGEIMHQMSLLCNIQFEWNKDSFLDYVKHAENMNCEIVYDCGNIVILKVMSFDAIKYLAKSTNWCISKNKQYWNNYMRDKNFSQYVMYDFGAKEDSETSIVGFTVRNGQGITHAHSFTNNNMMCERKETNMTTWLAEKLSGIFKHLSKHNVPSSVFSNKVDERFKWDKEHAIEYLERYVGKDYDVVCDNDGKFAFVTSNTSFVNFVGSNYEVMYNFVDKLSKFVVFLDFNLPNTDSNRIIYAPISEKDFSLWTEEFCQVMYNSSLNTISTQFEDKLDEYGIPHTVIKCSDDCTYTFLGAMRALNAQLVKELLKNDKLVKELKTKSYNYDIKSALVESIYTHKSFDLIDAFIETKVPLFSVLQLDTYLELNHSVLDDMSRYISAYQNGYVPTQKDVSVFYGNKNMSQHLLFGIGFGESVAKIISTETSGANFKSMFTRSVLKTSLSDGLKEYILFSLTKLTDFTTLNDISKANLDMVLNLHHDNTLKYIIENTKSFDVLNYISSNIGKNSKLKVELETRYSAVSAN